MTAVSWAPPASHEDEKSAYQLRYRRARLCVDVRSVATVLRIEGEIDILNADVIGDAVRRFMHLGSPYVLDCSHLDFLSVAGFRALLTLQEEHRQARVPTAIVAGHVLQRLARLVADHRLPIVDSVPEALALLADSRP
jgi:anti-sigma B factor antagonist